MHILLCCDNETVRFRWQDALTGKGRMHHVTSLRELETSIREYQAELALIHRNWADRDFMTALRLRHPQTRLFLFSDRPDEEEGLQYLRLGVVGYANTYMAPARLQEAVAAVVSGSVWVGQKLMQRLIREAGSAATPPQATGNQATAGLSRREHEIAQLVAEGLANQEIAARLDISESTVKVHLGHIYEKTGARGRLNLALLIKG